MYTEASEIYITKYKWDRTQGDILRQLIRKKGITFAQISKECFDAPRQHVHNIAIAEHNTIAKSKIEDIADYLEVDIKVFNLVPSHYQWTSLQGENLKQFIRKKQLTQREFAVQCLDKDIGYLTNIIHPANRMIDVSLLQKIITFLEIKPEEILYIPREIKAKFKKRQSQRKRQLHQKPKVVAH